MSDSNDVTCMKPGQFGWNELIARDPAASADFYGKLFGWQAVSHKPKGAPAGGPPYSLFRVEGTPEGMGLGGMVHAMDPRMPTQWIPYVVVEDVEASLTTATSLGAETVLAVTSIGEIGRIAVIKDPQGAMVGLHEFLK